MESKVRLKDSPKSPRKMRLVADIVRGMDADKALYILKLHNRKTYAQPLEKLLRSAIASYKEKHEANVEGNELFIKILNVDSGKSLKRVQAAPQGRAHRVRKRYNHITLILASKHSGEEVEASGNVEETEETNNNE